MLTQAVILVGGLGTRLGELTAATPKPMLPVAGRPFIEHLLQEISRFGIKRATLLSGQFGQQVQETYHGCMLFGMKIHVVIEPQPMGTGGALAFAKAENVLDPVFLLLNGDSWVEMNLTEVIGHWDVTRQTHPEVQGQLLLRTVPNVSRYGSVTVENGLVQSFREKVANSVETPGLINAGVYVLKSDIIDGIIPSQPISLENDILPKLVAKKQLSSIETPADAYFIDIGIPSSYRQAQEELIDKRTRPALFLDRDGTLNVDLGYTHKTDDLVWQLGAREAVKYANDLGYYVFVVTNQAGVAHGFYDEAAIAEFHSKMQSELFEIGAHIDAFEWCPHHPEGANETYRKICSCRKPASGMLKKLIETWPIDLSQSIMIGDSLTDTQAAHAIGVRGISYDGGSLFDLVRHSLKPRRLENNVD